MLKISSIAITFFAFGVVGFFAFKGEVETSNGFVDVQFVCFCGGAAFMFWFAKFEHALSVWANS